MMTCQGARDLMLVCLTGSTTPDERRALQVHLERCAACRAEAHALEETVGLLRTVPEPRLTEVHWAAFSRALQHRLEAEANTLWRRFVQWAHGPRVAWRMAAASAALVVALGATFLLRTAPPESTPIAGLPAAYRGMVTESMARAMPSMASTLDIWSAELLRTETPSDQDSTGGE